MQKEINRRVNTRKKIQSLSEVMKNKEISTKLKRKNNNACIMLCLTYRCQMYALTEKLCNTINIW